MSERFLTGLPLVFPISRPEVDEPGLDAFLRSEGIEGFHTDADTDADALPEIAGRLCYMSYARPRPGGNREYLRHILSVGHGSVLEHSNVGFILTGVSRSLTHELVRHRAGFAYSQLSQRYVDSSNVRFVVPPAILELGPESIDRVRFESHCLDSVGNYDVLRSNLLDKFTQTFPPTKARKLASEAARSVLPNATETKILVTANLRAWRHFIELRSDPGADLEIRRLARSLYLYLIGEAPAAMSGYRETVQHGTPSITTDHRKV